MKCPTSPKCIAKLVLRVTFGAALALIGVAHYMTLSGFVGMVSSDLGALSALGKIWAYVLPARQIVGCVLIVAKYRTDIATWAAGVALGSIAVGMLLKAVVGGASLGDVMGAVNYTMVWLLVYVMVVKCCLSSCCSEKSAPAPAPQGHSCPSC